MAWTKRRGIWIEGITAGDGYRQARPRIGGLDRRVATEGHDRPRCRQRRQRERMLAALGPRLAHGARIAAQVDRLDRRRHAERGKSRLVVRMDQLCVLD